MPDASAALTIRETGPADLAALLAVERRAFEREAEAALVAALLDDPTAQPRLSLLAWRGDRPLGHVLFTAVRIAGAPVMPTAAILAPLAVLPEAQGRGCGAVLVREGLARLAAADTGLVFVLGGPAYYGRFGFAPAGRHGLTTPYPIPAEHAEAWMVLELRPGLLGSVAGQVRCADALDRPEFWRE